MSTPTARASEVSITRVAIASLIGTTIEFYDFFIFGTASALVFGKLFFPSLSPLAGTLASFATFGVAFAARPLGALIFGHFGDRVSRKRMLVTSLVMMGLGTVAVGCLPTYASIGIAAPMLLVLCRLLQGLALGGEWGGAVLMALEHAPGKRRGFYASWPQVGVPLGLLVGTGLFYGLQRLPQESLESWGWRIPFLASAILVVTGLYIRLKLEDSPAFKAVKDTDRVERFPVVQALRIAPGKMLLGVLANTCGIPFYVATTFVYVYGKSTGLSHDTLLLGVALASFVQCFAVLLCGRLVDRFGRRPVMIGGAVATMVWAFPFFALLNTHNPVAVIIAFLGILPICHSMLYTPLSSFLPETFPTQLRYSGASLSYNLGNLLFSAPAPFVAEALYSAGHSAWSLALFVFAAGSLALVAVSLSRESKDDATHWTDRPGTAAEADHSRTGGARMQSST
ncbi:MFS transporter [Amycolatopsis thermoflava]